MFKYNQKTNLKKELLEIVVREEYKSGICDPQRVVATVEKKKN